MWNWFALHNPSFRIPHSSFHILSAFLTNSFHIPYFSFHIPHSLPDFQLRSHNSELLFHRFRTTQNPELITQNFPVLHNSRSICYRRAAGVSFYKDGGAG